jgi:hypothetical protein
VVRPIRPSLDTPCTMRSMHRDRVMEDFVSLCPCSTVPPRDVGISFDTRSSDRMPVSQEQMPYLLLYASSCRSILNNFASWLSCLQTSLCKIYSKASVACTQCGICTILRRLSSYNDVLLKYIIHTRQRAY